MRCFVFGHSAYNNWQLLSVIILISIDIDNLNESTPVEMLNIIKILKIKTLWIITKIIPKIWKALILLFVVCSSWIADSIGRDQTELGL